MRFHHHRGWWFHDSYPLVPGFREGRNKDGSGRPCWRSPSQRSTDWITAACLCPLDGQHVKLQWLTLIPPFGAGFVCEQLVYKTSSPGLLCAARSLGPVFHQHSLTLSYDAVCQVSISSAKTFSIPNSLSPMAALYAVDFLCCLGQRTLFMQLNFPRNLMGAYTL